MRVIDTDTIETPRGAFTMLLLDEKFPNTRWSKIVADGEEYQTTYTSGGKFDRVTIVGSHDLTGKEITFA